MMPAGPVDLDPNPIGEGPGRDGPPGGGTTPPIVTTPTEPTVPVVDPQVPFYPRPQPTDDTRKGRGAPHPSPVTDDPPVDDDPPDDGTPVPRPAPTRRVVKEPREIVINQSAAGLERDIPFGQFLQGTKWLYANTFSDGTIFYGVAAVGEGPVQTIYPRYNGKLLTHISGSETNPQGALYRYGSAGSPKIQVWVYDGSQTNTQETASGLFALDDTWITDDSDFASAALNPWNYLAFAVVKVTFRIGSQEEIPDFTFVGEGYRDLYDSTDTTRKYSENRALWMREILTNTRWGRKLPSAQVNDTVWATAVTDCRAAIFPVQPTGAPTMADGGAGAVTGTFYYKYTRVMGGVETLPSPISAATIVVSARSVDVTIPTGDTLTDEYRVYRSSNGGSTIFRRVGTLAGNTGGVFNDNMSVATWGSQARIPRTAPLNQYRYEGGGLLVSRKASTADWLNAIRAECLGVLQWNDGQLGLLINKAFSGTPKVYRDTHSGATKPNVDPDSVVWGRKPSSQLPNEVEVRFTDIQNGYQTASVVKSRAAVTAGTELARRAVYECRGIGDSAYAGRVATSLLNLLWDDMEGSFKANRSALATLPWDVVELHGGGLVGQDVRVRRIRGEGEDFRLYFTEYQSASYSDTIVEEDAPIAVEESNEIDFSVAPPEVDNEAIALDINSGVTPATLDGALLTFEFNSDYPLLEVRVYDGSGNLVMPPIPAASLPASIDVTYLVAFSSLYDGYYSGGLSLVLKTVNPAGVESTGVTVNAAESALASSDGMVDSHVPQTRTALQLSATAASNIGVAMPNGPGIVAVTVASGTGAGWHGAAVGAHSIAFCVNRTGGALVLYFESATETTAASRFTGPRGEVSGSVSIPDKGSFVLVRDNDGTTNRTRVLTVEPVWVDVAYDAGLYADTGTGSWTVDAGDHTIFRYRVEGNMLRVVVALTNTTISGAVSALSIDVPGGYSAAAYCAGVAAVADAACVARVFATGNTISVFKADGTDFGTGSSEEVSIDITIPIA